MANSSDERIARRIGSRKRIVGGKSGFLGRFCRDRRGNFALVTVLAAVPLLAAVGLAVDYSRVLAAKESLLDALDAGVLAVGSQTAVDDATAYNTVKTWLDVHMTNSQAASWSLQSVTQTADGKIAATASATVDLEFAGILGMNSLPISASNEAQRTLGKIELAMVLDNTGSMKGTKLDNLKSAADALIDTLETSASNPMNVKMGLVPYTMTVNVGPQYQNQPWITGTLPAAYGADIFNTLGIDRFKMFSQMGVSWAGCVEARPSPNDVTEAPPVATDYATLYVPYFAPDEPDTTSGQSCNQAGYCNNYLPDVSTSTNWMTRQGYQEKYVTAPKTGTNPIGYQFGPNSGCDVQPLTRLTTDKSAFKTAVNAMVAGGDTDIKAGVMWGWHVLSPNAPFNDGAAYDDTNWTKIMVLMTDGQNHNVVVNDGDQSVYSGIGYIWQNRIGITGGTLDQRIAILDQKLGQACTNAKAAGIVIYSVVLDDPTVDQTTVRNCASSQDKIFDVTDSSGLVAAFQKIGGSLQKLSLDK